MSYPDATTRTAADELRARADVLDDQARQLTVSAAEHRERVARQEANAGLYREQANDYREAADRLDRIESGGVVVNVHVTETGADVMQAVADALQASANRAAQ